jgi:glycosyltransferase involved in cell wall biosynthesis
MQKVLIVTYYWPPGSGAGVQRWLKFSKYLREYGWEPVILTVDPEFAAYPATDSTLEKEIPGNLTVYRTRAKDYFRFYKSDKSKIPSSGFAAEDKKTIFSIFARFIRGNLFIPDPRRGWNKYAFRKACDIIHETGITHVITTSPPHSTQLVGLRLRKKFPEIRWIADLRDPWTDIYYYKEFFPTCLSKYIDSTYEKRVLNNADRIITVGRSLRDSFISKVPASASKIGIITNGYDSDDFEGLSSSEPSVFTISYTGTLSDKYPVYGFLEALERLTLMGVSFRLKFTGYVSENQRRLIGRYPFAQNTEFNPYAEHQAAIRSILDSSVLLLIIPDHKSSGSIITGKLFEYLASGKRVICLGPREGDAAQIIKDCGQGMTFSYTDADGISSYLEALITKPHETGSKPPEKYSRKNLSGELARLLNSIDLNPNRINDRTV